MQNTQAIEKKQEIVVTDAMIDAGLDELSEFKFGEDFRFVIESVYRAMAYKA